MQIANYFVFQNDIQDVVRGFFSKARPLANVVQKSIVGEWDKDVLNYDMEPIMRFFRIASSARDYLTVYNPDMLPTDVWQVFENEHVRIIFQQTSQTSGFDLFEIGFAHKSDFVYGIHFQT